MNDLPYNEDPNDPCMYCTHSYSVHFSDDVHGLGSKDFKDIYTGCTYINPNGSECSCQGFKSSLVPK